MLDIWTRLEALPPVQYPAEARSAVLVPVYRDANQQVRVILTRRPDHMRTHPGDVVFPGGRFEGGETPEETAKREACEEIGLPPDGVEVIGGLSPRSTRSRRNLIIPVVAKVQRPAEFVLQEEEVSNFLAKIESYSQKLSDYEVIFENQPHNHSTFGQDRVI